MVKAGFFTVFVSPSDDPLSEFQQFEYDGDWKLRTAMHNSVYDQFLAVYKKSNNDINAWKLANDLKMKVESNENLSFAFDCIGILDPFLCSLRGVEIYDMKCTPQEWLKKMNDVKIENQYVRKTIHNVNIRLDLYKK